MTVNEAIRLLRRWEGQGLGCASLGAEIDKDPADDIGYRSELVNLYLFTKGNQEGKENAGN